MYDYMIGTVTNIKGNAIILENQKIGYYIFTPNTFAYEEGKEYKVYLYQKIKEDEHTLFGFKTEEEKEEAQFSVMDLTIFENVAYVMAKHGDPSTPDSIDEWMDQFELFSIYEVLPEILKLWNLNTAQTSTPKKK